MTTSITRRSFARLGILALTAGVGLATFASPRVAWAEAKLAFTIYADKAGEFRWRLAAGNGAILATSGQGYKAKADARAGVERIRNDLQKLTFEIYEDGKGESRWRLKAKNGQVVGVSSEGYRSKADADAATARVQAGSRDASVTDET
jgi:uncharacterized protein YegP (UPF0339 family)